jgi:2-(1,2-epoxy-1,2-dihydrophenyl)acetyl-CoA isomerase
MNFAAKESVLTEIQGSVGTIILNRPEQANTLDSATSQALIEAVHAIAADDSIRVVLLKGSGKIFCAGGDIGGFTRDIDNLPGLLGTMLTPLHDAILKLATLPVPVVVALNGPIGGGGIGLALCADFVLAAESMKLRGGYSAIGLTPDVGSSWFLTRRAGAARAKEIFFLNGSMSARECLACGIVDAVYPDDELISQANSLVSRLATGATGSFAKIKDLVDGVQNRSLQGHLALEREYMIAAGGSPDAREGVVAAIEKRAPIFGGRMK